MDLYRGNVWDIHECVTNEACRGNVERNKNIELQAASNGFQVQCKERTNNDKTNSDTGRGTGETKATLTNKTAQCGPPSAAATADEGRRTRVNHRR